MARVCTHPRSQRGASHVWVVGDCSSKVQYDFMNFLYKVIYTHLNKTWHAGSSYLMESHFRPHHSPLQVWQPPPSCGVTGWEDVWSLLHSQPGRQGLCPAAKPVCRHAHSPTLPKYTSWSWFVFLPDGSVCFFPFKTLFKHL